jgi:hypothetical protein
MDMEEPRITIELSARKDDVPLAAFIKVIERLQTLLRGLDRSLAGESERTTAWEIVGASLASPLTISLGPSTAGSVQRADAVLSACVLGLAGLDREACTPPGFTVSALEAARELVSVLGDGIGRIGLGYGDVWAVPTQRVAAHVDALMQTVEQPGVVEGLLEHVNAHRDRKFYVYDVLTDQRVPCTFGDGLREAVKTALYERVAVHGLVRFGPTGRALSMKAESIEVFPGAGDLPQFFGIPAMDITGGADPVDYLEELYEDA